jgi:hypothetical protein
MKAGVMGHRHEGMQGLYVVLGVDPATVGNTAMIVAGLDRVTGKRWILDGFNKPGISPQTMRDTIKNFCDKYNVNTVIIERNAFQKFLTDDPELVRFFQSRGIKKIAHYTTGEKVDPDFGVAAMAPLFESTGRPPKNNGGGIWSRVDEGDLIELPDERQSAWCSALVQQLISWEPSGLAQGHKTDLVMALWFCDLTFKKLLVRNRELSKHQDNPFLSRDRRRQRQVVNIAEYRAAQIAEREAV